ncbi:MAG TPA: hypothetical protein VH619_02675 [Verrucomicrobiae bacterium]|jgi:hypothetical protein|nr:hypothetical protein [Verrucomicrobiae bacterium]
MVLELLCEERIEGGNVIHRIRLKLTASTLHFDGYDDFEDYFGLRCHYFLSGVIATIPVPFVFAKGQFERGIAAKLLNELVADPYLYLDEAGGKKMNSAHSDLLRKFTELAFDESVAVRWQESQPTEADNIDVGPVTETESQNDLIESSGSPF